MSTLSAVIVTATGLDAGQVIRWRSWHRWTAICLLAYLFLAVAIACSSGTTPPQARTPGSSRSPSRKCCGSCATPSSRRPGGTGPTGCTGRTGGAATSTAPAKLTDTGTPTQRRHRDHNELQLPYPWSTTDHGPVTIRRYPPGHAGSFRTVRDLGRFPARSSCESGKPQSRPYVWLPNWLPGERLAV